MNAPRFNPWISKPVHVPWSDAGPGVMAELINESGDRVRLYAHQRADGLAQWLVRNRTTGDTARGVSAGMPRAVHVAGDFAIKNWGELDEDPDRFDQLMLRSSSITP